MTRAALIALVLLAGCGVDGRPTPPEGATPGVKVEGQVIFGVSGRG